MLALHTPCCLWWGVGGQVSPSGPTAAAPPPTPVLSVRVCRLLGRCHPLDPSTLQPEAVPENMTDQVCNSAQFPGTYDCGDGYVCLNGDYEAFYVSTLR